MANDDSRDPSAIPRSYRWQWLLGVVLASLLAGVFVYVCGEAFDLFNAFFPPKVLGRAPWEGEVTSEINRAMPLLEKALTGANRVVVTMRKGIFFHTAGGSKPRGFNRIITYPPCRVHESRNPFVRRHFLSYLKLREFGHTDRDDCGLIFHFYNDEKLLVVLGWIGGDDVILRGHLGDQENYLRWFDGGWQGDAIPSWTRMDFMNWFGQNGMQLYSQIGMSEWR